MSLVKTSVLFGLLIMLSGCITTMEKDVAKVNPEKALATHVQLGLGYIRENNMDSARFHLTKAAELAPNDPGMLNGRGLLYQLEGEPKLAEESFKKALREDSNFTSARLNYATFLYGKERYKDAYEQYEKASDDLGYDRRAVALYGVGIAGLKLGKNDRALAAFKQSVMLDKGLAPAHLELAGYYFDVKDYAECKKSLDKFEKLSRPTARSLWLSIRIEQIFGNKDKEASQVMSLKNMFPYSPEYLDYKKSQGRP
ncbi:type IV pilus biogenesis/stability protein PilW [Simiduia litorea]|uniref:type IV pilus biogenesis/stability protein PilW n=1 Tax=Simiduia litorea TaxID=1435348 RepID=UPI0036F3A119